MTKADKFRKASQICWLIGAALTWNFIRTITQNSISEPAVAWAVAAVVSMGLQYLLTLVESTIISGMLPAPWNISFKRNTTEAILAIAAFGCFFFDVMLNLGGTYVITSQLGTAVGDVKQLGISDYIIKVTVFLATFFFAILFALGSELLDALADMYEGKPQNRIRFQQSPQEHKGPAQQQKQQKTGPNEQQLLHEMLAQRPQEREMEAAIVHQQQTGPDIKSRLQQSRDARKKGL